MPSRVFATSAAASNFLSASSEVISWIDRKCSRMLTGISSLSLGGNSTASRSASPNSAAPTLHGCRPRSAACAQCERLSLPRAADRVLHCLREFGYYEVDGATLKDWAAAFGITREHLYRTLSQLQKSGRIRRDAHAIRLP